MKKNSLFVLAACFGVLLSTASLWAHHAASAAYDVSKKITLAGNISKLEWKNPHIWFYVDVKDARGKVVTWGFSGGPPAFLVRQGIHSDVMKIGDVVKVEGFQARDGSNNASGGKVTFANGRSVFTASAEDARPD